MTDRELMQWALDALDGYARNCKCEGGGGTTDAAEALRARLSQPEEKIKCQHKFEVDEDAPLHSCCQICGEVRKQPEQEPVVKWDASAPLVVHPHPAFQATQPDLAKVGEVGVWGERQWQGLTDAEIREFEIWLDDEEEKHGWNPPADIVKYIEAKLKEKNNE